MIANGVRNFLSFYLQLTIAGFTLFILKKPGFVEDVLFYPWNEVSGFDSHHILQEASEELSCNETGS